MNVFSAELHASCRTRFVESRLNQPGASWQKVVFTGALALGKVHPSSSKHGARGQLSTESQAGSVSFDLEMYTTKFAIVGAVKSLWQGPFRFEFCGSLTF